TYNNNAQTPAVPVLGSLIGPGVRFDETNPITIPNSESLAWTDSSTLTWSAWVKPTANQPNAIIFHREGFSIGADKGLPFIDVSGNRAGGAQPMAPNSWHHIAVTAAGSSITLYIDGQSAATLSTALPTSSAALSLGDTFTGELDELEISKVARPAGFIKIAAM